MKKILFLLMALGLVAPSLKAQEKFAEYQAGIEGKSYDIKVGKIDKKKNFLIYIDIQNSENEDSPMYINIGSNKLSKFKDAILQIKNKYAEWKQVAIDNNVANMTKPFGIYIPRDGGAFYYGREWFFADSVTLSAVFFLVNDIPYIGLMCYFTARDNQFIKSSGNIIFLTEKEVDDFLNALDENGMRALAEGKASTENLFN